MKSKIDPLIFFAQKTSYWQKWDKHFLHIFEVVPQFRGHTYSPSPVHFWPVSANVSADESADKGADESAEAQKDWP